MSNQDVLPDVFGFDGKSEALPVALIGAEGNVASVTDTGEIMTSTTERERNVFLTISKNDVSQTGHMVAIDLSNTTGFKHQFPGQIHICAIYSHIDRESNTIGEIKIGLITRIDATSADVEYVETFGFHKTSADEINIAKNYSPSQLKLKPENGRIAGAIGNLITVAEINTATPIETPIGTTTPEVGDIVLSYIFNNSPYSFNLNMFFHGEI